MSKNLDAVTSAPSAPSTPNHTQSNGSRLLTASDFINAVRQGTIPDLNAFQISGDVDLAGETIAKPLVIHGASFTGTVNLSQVRFERGVDFSQCRFQKLILSDARVEGPLTLNSVVIGVESEPVPDVEMLRQIVARLREGCRRSRSRRTEPAAQRTRKRARLRRRWRSRRRWQDRLEEAEAKHGNPQIVAAFDNLHIAGSLSMIKARIFGALSCAHAEIEDDFNLTEAHIYGMLSLRHTSLGELHTNGEKPSVTPDAGRTNDETSRVHGELDLASATITGDVRLLGMVVSGELIVQAANIDGNLICKSNKRVRTRLRKGARFLNVRVKGFLDFSGTQCNGPLDLSSGYIGASLVCARSNNWYFTLKGKAAVRNIRVDADINFGGSRVQGDVGLINAKIGNSVFLTGTRIVGNLVLQNASIGSNLFLTSTSDSGKNIRCEISKKAWMLGVTVTGNVVMSGVHVGNDLIMQSANVGQNLMATIMGGFQSQVDGNTFLNGARIHGSVEFGGVVLLGDLNLDGASIDGGLNIFYDFDDAADWQVKHSRIGGKLDAKAVTIGKRVVLAGLIVGSADSASTLTEPGANFVGAEINGEFSLYSQNLFSEILRSKKSGYQATPISPERERAVKKQARQQRTVIHGDLRLTRVQVSGDISLSGASIDGELDLRDANVRANIICEPIKLDRDVPPMRASVHRADLETLDMTGDINLTGLTVRGKQNGRGGDLNLRDARVRGRLELCPRMGQGELLLDDRRYRDKITLIRDDLQLDAAEISHVIISGENLEKDNSDRVRVGLERTTIGRLQILQPLPGTLDLSNLKVNRLDRLDEDSSIYKDMLKNSFPFRKSNYLLIEHTMRNAGLDAQADQVHVLMRRRDRPPLRSFFRWVLDVFLDASIRYGTTSKRLACIMLLWFGVSVWIFSDYKRVEYATPQPGNPQMAEPPKRWSRGDAGLFAARLHVPIISLGVEEKAQPSGTRWKVYAMVVVALSWVMWPLLIASASGLIRKRE